MAVAIFIYLFKKYPLTDVITALSHSDLPLFIALTVGYFFYQYLFDSYATTKIFNHFGHALHIRDIFSARGATYLIMNINYAASQAAFAYYLKRTKNISVSEVSSIFLLIMFVDFYWIIALAFFGSFFQDYTLSGLDLGTFVRLFTYAAAAAFLLHLIFWRKWYVKIFQNRAPFKPFTLLREKKFFRIFNRTRTRDYFYIALLRAPLHLAIIFGLYLAVFCFNAEIPFVKILGNVPLVYFIGTIPITPGGLGTTNAAMVALLHPYVTSPLFDQGVLTPQTLIFALTLSWMFANFILKILFGALWLKRSSRELFQPVDESYTQKIPI